MRKLKVLHYCNKIGLGATERSALLWCKYLNKNLFDVFFATREEENLRKKFCEEIGLKIFSGNNLSYLFNELGIDILHLHRAGINEPIPFNLLKQETPLIVETNVFGRVDNSPVNNKIKAHLFMSQTVLNKYLNIIKNKSENKIYDYLYNPIEESFYIKEDIKKDFNNVIGRISREDIYKWGSESIFSINELVKENTNIKYKIIGATKEIKNYFFNNGFDNYIEYYEQTSDDIKLKNFYNSINVFTHSSQIGETFGSTIAEAMSQKLPIVTVRKGTLISNNKLNELADNAQEELIEDFTTGIIVNNQSEFVNSINLLLRNKKLAKGLGINAYNKSRKLFHVTELTKKLERIYAKVANIGNIN